MTPKNALLGIALLAILLSQHQLFGQNQNSSYVEKVKISASTMTFEFNEDYQNFTIEISGPAQFYLKKELHNANTFVLNKKGYKDKPFPEGSYIIQITPSLKQSKAEQKILRYLTETNQYEKLATRQALLNIPAEIGKYNRYFSIKNGEFVLPQHEQYGLKLPTSKNNPTANLSTLRLYSNKFKPTFTNLSLEKNTNKITADHLGLNPKPIFIDQVFNDDVIVDGSLCVGFDCADGEDFGFDTQRFKENNLRVHFDDTSNSASFAANDWRIIINGSNNGDPNFFAVEDATAGRTPFLVEAGARANALYVSDNGNIGIGTATPVVNAHIVTGNTPTIRFEQDASSGFGTQTWDMASNEANFFIRDITNGSLLPFRIRPSAPTSSIDIASNGEVGIGVGAPEARVHIRGLGDGSDTDAFITQNSSGNTHFIIQNDGKVVIGDADAEQELHIEGDIAISGSILPVSDIRLKKNIQTIENSLSIIQLLNPASYDFRIKKYAEMNLPTEIQYGFIAQELEKVLPSLVANSNNPDKEKAFKRVNYTGLIPFLVKGMQEQQAIIDNQRAKMEALEAKLDEMDALKQQVAALAKLIEAPTSESDNSANTVKK